MRSVVSITRAVGPSLAECALTFLEREPIDTSKAAHQHALYCKALEESGIAVEVLSAEPHLPDAVFVEDVAVVLDELAVIARPGIDTRQREVATVRTALAKHRALEEIRAPGTLEGGDVLKVGRKIFVGMSSRTNRDGYEQFARMVTRYGYQIRPIAVEGCLHLKTAVTALTEQTLLMHSGWVDAGALHGLEHVRAPESEPFGANVLAVNGVVLVSAKWPGTHELLERRGFAVKALDISEFEKAEAGLTCLSLIFGS